MDYEARFKEIEDRQYAILGMFVEANMRARLLKQKACRFENSDWSPEKDAFDPVVEANKIRSDLAKYRVEFDETEAELASLIEEVCEQHGHIS